MIRLDDTNINEFDILIVDVEGKEHEVLLGGKEKIKQFKPIILIEIWGNKKRSLENMNLSSEDIVNFIINLNYKIASRFGDNYIFVPEDLNVD